ncbi:MAG TPA: BPSS1780 family membrane protein [Xylella sp.]
MSEIRKVPAASGAQWLLAGFALLRRAPLQLGRLGMFWGVVSVFLMMLGAQLPSLGNTSQFLMILIGPLLMGGLLWAVREVDEGRTARLGHLLQGLHDGRAPHLLVSLLPQLVAGAFMGGLLLLMLGSSGLEQLFKLFEINQSGVQLTPEDIEQLAVGFPVVRFLFWFVLVVLTFVAMIMALFVMLPQVMFDRADGLHALNMSLRAGLRNFPALLVFFLLAFISVLAVCFVMAIPALLISKLFGDVIATVVLQVFLVAVLMPVFTAAVYEAWKQMFVHMPSVRQDVFAA